MFAFFRRLFGAASPTVENREFDNVVVAESRVPQVSNSSSSSAKRTPFDREASWKRISDAYNPDPAVKYAKDREYFTKLNTLRARERARIEAEEKAQTRAAEDKILMKQKEEEEFRQLNIRAKEAREKDALKEAREKERHAVIKSRKKQKYIERNQEIYGDSYRTLTKEEVMQSQSGMVEEDAIISSPVHKQRKKPGGVTKSETPINQNVAIEAVVKPSQKEAEQRSESPLPFGKFTAMHQSRKMKGGAVAPLAAEGAGQESFESKEKVKRTKKPINATVKERHYAGSSRVVDITLGGGTPNGR